MVVSMLAWNRKGYDLIHERFLLSCFCNIINLLRDMGYSLQITCMKCRFCYSAKLDTRVIFFQCNTKISLVLSASARQRFLNWTLHSSVFQGFFFIYKKVINMFLFCLLLSPSSCDYMYLTNNNSSSAMRVLNRRPRHRQDCLTWFKKFNVTDQWLKANSYRTYQLVFSVTMRFEPNTNGYLSRLTMKPHW